MYSSLTFSQGMLVRQQAQALLDARKVVIEGAVSIVTGAVGSLATNGVKLTDHESARLVSNLLSVLCSESKVSPMFSISESVDKQSDASAAQQVELIKAITQLNTTLKLKQ